MYKILTVITLMILPILAQNTTLVPKPKTPKNETAENIQKDLIAKINNAIDRSIDRQQKTNVSEAIDVPHLRELKDQLKAANGTDLSALQARDAEATRHGKLDVTIQDIAMIFQEKRKREMKIMEKAEKKRDKMRKRIDKWVAKEEKKKEMKRREEKNKMNARKGRERNVERSNGEVPKKMDV